MKELANEIGSRIRELREVPDGLAPKPIGEPSLTAADVASAAREIGLSWRISTVRAIELGDRKIWAVEFLLLGEIFRRAWAHKGVDVVMPLATFLPRERVVAGAVVVDPGGLLEVVSGRPFPPEALEIAGPELLSELPARVARLEPRWVIPEENLPPSLDLPRLGREARGDPEQKLARKLGVRPEAVVIAAHDRWEMGLTRVRDQELGDVAGLGAESVRTKRGRVTLRLGKELADDARRIQSMLTAVSEPPPGQHRGVRRPAQARRSHGPGVDWFEEYRRLVSRPWSADLAPPERVWMVIAPVERSERHYAERHRRLLRDMKRITEEAGHRWVQIDLWSQLERGLDPQEPSTLGRLAAQTETVLADIAGSGDVDDGTVVAFDGLDRFFPAEQFAKLLRHICPLVPGRLMAFLPGPAVDSAPQLLTGRDGWGFLATTTLPGRTDA